MDVHRGGDPVALVGAEGLQRGGHHVVPAFLPRHLVEVAERALLRPVEDVEAEHLHRRRRIPRGHPGAQRGHGLGAAPTGHRHVLPGDALGFQVLLEHVQGRGLAARGPPVQHLHLVRGGGAGGAERSRRGKQGSGQKCTLHRCLLLRWDVLCRNVLARSGDRADVVRAIASPWIGTRPPARSQYADVLIRLRDRAGIVPETASPQLACAPGAWQHDNTAGGRLPYGEAGRRRLHAVLPAPGVSDEFDGGHRGVVADARRPRRRQPRLLHTFFEGGKVLPGFHL